MQYCAIVADDYISHHGVKGMKWGVRKYQNKDGSLTSAGKKHLGIYNTHVQRKKSNKQQAHILAKKYKKFDNKDFLSDKEQKEHDSISRSIDKLRIDTNEHYKANRRSIRVGEKIAASQGNKDAQKSILSRKANRATGIEAVAALSMISNGIRATKLKGAAKYISYGAVLASGVVAGIAKQRNYNLNKKIDEISPNKKKKGGR